MDFGELRARFFKALDREGGSVSAAARAVGVNTNTAYGWARKAGSGGRGRAGTLGMQAVFHRLRASLMSRRAAAVEVGVRLCTAQDWESGWHKEGHVRIHDNGPQIDYNTGMTTIRTAAPGPSLIAEPETIADLRRQHVSLRAIGRQLSWPASTIERELDVCSRDGIYRSHAAQRAWARSRSRPKDSKLAKGGQLRDYVARRLQERWPPEQIGRALVIESPSGRRSASEPETI